MVTKKC